jgi:DNA repair protein RadC
MTTQLMFGDLAPAQPSLRTLRETPHNRVLTHGAGALSNVELLGALLGDPDLALRLLSAFPTLRDLGNAMTSELQGIRGVGPTRVAQIKSALELGRRHVTENDTDRPQIRTPADAASILMPQMMHLEQEEMRVVLLDTRNRVVGIETIYKGSVNTAMVRAAEVLRPAIRANCPAIIVSHAHPSGDPEPSPEDVACTRDLIQAAKLLDIDLVDHLIVARQRFVSLRERGLAFE